MGYAGGTPLPFELITRESRPSSGYAAVRAGTRDREEGGYAKLAKAVSAGVPSSLRTPVQVVAAGVLCLFGLVYFVMALAAVGFLLGWLELQLTQADRDGMVLGVRGSTVVVIIACLALTGACARLAWAFMSATELAARRDRNRVIREKRLRDRLDAVGNELRNLSYDRLLTLREERREICIDGRNGFIDVTSEPVRDGKVQVFVEGRLDGSWPFRFHRSQLVDGFYKTQDGSISEMTDFEFERLGGWD